MGFNVGSYIKESAKTAGQRIVDDAVNKAVNGLPISAQLIAATAAGSFLNIGATSDSIDTFTAAITDSIISSTIEEFKELAGVNVDVASKRNVTTGQSVNAFLASVNPKTKIDAAGSGKLEVIVVV